MRILLLTQWYPPEPQEFLAEMAQSLKALGHEVTAVSYTHLTLPTSDLV